MLEQNPEIVEVFPASKPLIEYDSPEPRVDKKNDEILDSSESLKSSVSSRNSDDSSNGGGDSDYSLKSSYDE